LIKAALTSPGRSRRNSRWSSRTAAGIVRVSQLYHGARGTTVLALSANDEEQARQTQEQWGLEGLRLGYDLSIDTARAWGLFISSRKPGSEEPEYFAEPGVFLVRPDATLYAAIINTMPFARPHLKDVLSGLDFVIKNDYPARGEA
jgi:peroxiredoxin